MGACSIGDCVKTIGIAVAIAIAILFFIFLTHPLWAGIAAQRIDETGIYITFVSGKEIRECVIRADMFEAQRNAESGTDDEKTTKTETWAKDFVANTADQDVEAGQVEIVLDRVTHKPIRLTIHNDRSERETRNP